MKGADIVVVGAGAIGTSIAYHLALLGAGSVLVVEMADSACTGATAACAGGFRHQFSSRINVELSRASIALMGKLEDTLGARLDIITDGYLFLARSVERYNELVVSVGLLSEMNIEVELLSPTEAASLIPGLNVADIVGATFCPRDGIADPFGLTFGYLQGARALGVEAQFGTEVRGIRLQGGSVTGVETGDGFIPSNIVINAAGPWAARLAQSASVSLPVVPLRRSVVLTSDFPGRPDRHTLVVDTQTGFYFHREGPGVLMGMGSKREVPGFDWELPADFLEDELIPAAIRTLPALEAAGVVKSWSGFYEMTPDAHPILGPVPEVGGLWLANGFSGHGFQQAPIVGLLTAEWIRYGWPRTMDISSLQLSRFERGELLSEARVI
jgi:sarcosine oxidase subunit beta